MENNTNNENISDNTSDMVMSVDQINKTYSDVEIDSLVMYNLECIMNLITWN